PSTLADRFRLRLIIVYILPLLSDFHSQRLVQSYQRLFCRTVIDNMENTQRGLNPQPLPFIPTHLSLPPIPPTIPPTIPPILDPLQCTIMPGSLESRYIRFESRSSSMEKNIQVPSERIPAFTHPSMSTPGGAGGQPPKSYYPTNLWCGTTLYLSTRRP
ncbi:hypothetical protein BDR07DRAFT_1517131, partial [Suillus spraguei]